MSTGLSVGDAEWVRALFERKTGIRLGPSKHDLIANRLVPRLRARGLEHLETYVQLLREPAEELERALLVDRLTTHETSFFREPEHFAVLHRYARQAVHPGPLRVWSAACSTGEEAATAAWVLEAAQLGRGYEIVGTDVAHEAVRQAATCTWSLERTEGVDPQLLQRYCLKGIGDAAGTFCLKPWVQRRLSFRVANLLEPIADLGRFEVIFLRNVLIYFDDARRRAIVQNVLQHLLPGGLLLPGHTESVRDASDALEAMGPAVYRYQPRSGGR
jgi:chemotaxis protein methyltransferase CheR